MIETQFIEYIVKQLVDEPEAVKIERIVDDRGILLKLSVAPADLGRVIGKGGATAQALRAVLRAFGMKNNDHYNLKIVDVDRDEASREGDFRENAGESRASRNDERLDGEEGRKLDESDGSRSSREDRTVERENVEDVENSDSENVENSDETSTRTKKLREELAGLDDLDV